MLVIKTMVHETIWGGNRLTPYSGTNNQKIGHLYSLISNGELESEILNGKYKGQLFRKYFDDNKEKFGMGQYRELPFLLALVDATQDLSLQVHPNDEMAKKLENADFGKNESWYFLEIPKTGKIYDGCKAKTSAELRKKVAQNKYDDVINYLDVEVGSYVYIKAGTMHAMAAGSLVYEIEENCNATYRVYDFDRIDKDGKKRPLQTENALNSIIVEKKSKSEKYEIGVEKKERLYSTKLMKNITEYKNNTKTIECLTFLNGENELDSCKIQKGVTVVLEPNETIKVNCSDFIVSRALMKKEMLMITNDVETFVGKWFSKNHPNFFNVERDREFLKFNIEENMFINPYYTIRNIVFDITEERVSLSYELDGNHYQFFKEIDNQGLLVNISEFLSSFLNIYRAGMELKILSEHQENFGSTHCSIRRIEV